MGVTETEHQLFDSKIDPRDHRVAKYMVESICKDAVHGTMYVGNKIKLGITATPRVIGKFARSYLNMDMLKTIGSDAARVGKKVASGIRALPKLSRIYLSGYVNEEHLTATSFTNETIGLVSGTINVLTASASAYGAVLEKIGEMVGITFFLAYLPFMTQYGLKKYREAVRAIYGIPTI